MLLFFDFQQKYQIQNDTTTFQTATINWVTKSYTTDNNVNAMPNVVQKQTKSQVF